MGKVAQDQARAYNLRERDWRPKTGDLTWGRHHQISKADIGFVAKIAPKYEDPLKVSGFV